MSELTAELGMRVRVSDPNPSHCSGCLQSAGVGVRFADFQAVVSRGTFVDQNGAMAVLDDMEELHLCEACVRQACEALDIRPELHRRQVNRMRDLLRENEQLREALNRQIEQLADLRLVAR